VNIIERIGKSDLVKDWQKQLKKNTRQLITGLAGLSQNLSHDKQLSAK
jgi:transcription-repair coupling factor (superfamily II helicase)